MKQPAPRPADERPGRREPAEPKAAHAAMARLDLELPDGRYLLVYSKAPKPNA